MTTLPTGQAGRYLALVLLLAVLAAAWQAMASPLLALYADQAATLEQRSALASRMAQVSASLPDLMRDSTQGAPGATPRPQVLLQGPIDAVAGAALQQLVLDMAGRTGATVGSTETLPAEVRGGYRQVAVRVAVSASWAKLVRLLAAIEEAQPIMLVDDLQLRRGPLVALGTEQAVEASLTVIGFRAAGAAGASDK